MTNCQLRQAGRVIALLLALASLAAGVLMGKPFGDGVEVVDAAQAAPAEPTAILQALYFPLVTNNAQLVIPGWATAAGILTVEIDPYVGTGGNAAVYPLSFDALLTTPDKNRPGYTGFDFVNNDKWLYIGSEVPFTKIRVYAEILPGGYGGGRWGHSNPNGAVAQYFDGKYWSPFGIQSDSTVVGGNSFAQNGIIEFTLSGGPMVKTTEAGISAYFIRGRFNFSADRIHIPEIQPWGLIRVGG